MSDWTQSKDSQRRLHNFNQTHASKPSDFKEAKTYNDEIMKNVDTGMKERGWDGRLEYTGSSYEGTKVNSGNEFDVMKVQRRDDLVVRESDKAGFAKLEVKPGADSSGRFVQDGYLSTEKYKSQFKGDLQRSVDSQLSSGQVKRLDHGPADQLDAYKGGHFSHSVDFVPAVEVDGRLFTPKGSDNSAGWRESYSVKEKNDLKTSDKETIRTLKAMREHDAPLKGLDTYRYKNAVLHHSATPGFESMTGTEKVTSTMSYMQERCADGNLPSYNNEKINLLDGKSDVQLENVGNRLGNLSVNEGKFSKVLERPSKN